MKVYQWILIKISDLKLSNWSFKRDIIVTEIEAWVEINRLTMHPSSIAAKWNASSYRRTDGVGTAPRKAPGDLSNEPTTPAAWFINELNAFCCTLMQIRHILFWKLCKVRLGTLFNWKTSKRIQTKKCLLDGAINSLVVCTLFEIV